MKKKKKRERKESDSDSSSSSECKSKRRRRDHSHDREDKKKKHKKHKSHRHSWDTHLKSHTEAFRLMQKRKCVETDRLPAVYYSVTAYYRNLHLFTLKESVCFLSLFTVAITSCQIWIFNNDAIPRLSSSNLCLSHRGKRLLIICNQIGIDMAAERLFLLKSTYCLQLSGFWCSGKTIEQTRGE